MKLLTTINILLISLCCFSTCKGWQSPEKKITDANELTDLKGVLYAGNLKNWNDRHVDSLLFGYLLPDRATDDKNIHWSCSTTQAALLAVTGSML